MQCGPTNFQIECHAVLTLIMRPTNLCWVMTISAIGPHKVTVVLRFLGVVQVVATTSSLTVNFVPQIYTRS